MLAGEKIKRHPIVGGVCVLERIYHASRLIASVNSDIGNDSISAGAQNTAVGDALGRSGWREILLFRLKGSIYLFHNRNCLII